MIDTYRLGRRCTNTGTSASAITSDSDLGGPSGAERVERGCDVQIASGTIKGGTTRIAGTPVLSTGTFNVDPNLTGALAAADLFDILYRPLRFTKGEHVMEAAINAALRRFAWEKRIVPLTLCPDGDMLAAGTTSWSEVGGGALSKVVEAFPYGLPALRMTGVAALACLAAAKTSYPLLTGIRRSKTKRSGCHFLASSIAALPSYAAWVS